MSSYKFYLIAAFLVLAVLLAYPSGYFVLGKKQDQTFPQPQTVQGIGVYLITLDRFKERQDYVMKNISKLGLPVRKVSDIDGQAMSEAELREKVDFKSYKTFLGHYPKRGIIGCSLSHIEAWEMLLRSNFEFALIFEDDVSFDPILLSKTIEALTHNTDLWDITSFEILHRGMPLTIKSFDGENLAIYLTEVTHSGAYIITRKAAAALLSKALPLKMPIDHYFTRSWEFGLKFTGIEPRIVAQTYGDSTIGPSSGSDNLNQEHNGVIMPLNKAMYKLQSYVIRFFYNLALYVELKILK